MGLLVSALLLLARNAEAQNAQQQTVLAQQQAAVVQQQAAIQQKMAASLDAQRQSVRRQTGAQESQSESFFTVPWVRPKVTYIPAADPDCDEADRSAIEQMVRESAQREGVTPDLLRAVIEQESAYSTCAVSPKGAQGLMQLMPATQDQFGVTDPFDPQQNIAAGARLLKQLLERYGGNLMLALGAYNAGPANVDKKGGLPDFPETRRYVTDILQRLQIQ